MYTLNSHYHQNGNCDIISYTVMIYGKWNWEWSFALMSKSQSMSTITFFCHSVTHLYLFWQTFESVWKDIDSLMFSFVIHVIFLVFSVIGSLFCLTAQPLVCIFLLRITKKWREWKNPDVEKLLLELKSQWVCNCVFHCIHS